ncbi:hypothetical protein LQ764DRAFT_211178 [Zygosaccharomyces rouxii]|nr:hypothetical protein LQ764DRAFT_211178 [Zygosaccharomyces rouxii]
MVEYNLDNIQHNLNTDKESPNGFEHFSPSTFSIHNDNNSDNGTQRDDKNLSEEAAKISKFDNEFLPNLDDDIPIETGFSPRNNDKITWRKIVESSNKRQEIFTKFKEASQQINPIEFESYHDFFVLNTFKKGKSVSGYVDIENVMKNNAQHHRRSKRNNHDPSVREPITSPGSSSLSDDGDYDENDDGNREIEKLSRSRESPVDEIEEGPKKRRSRTQVPVTSDDHLQIDEAELSLSTNPPGGERRSTRLLNKANNNNSSSNPDSEDSSDEHGEALIKDLYESIVPKVEQPYRRSDWVLPSRLRYTPDKQMRTKPEFEKGIVKV